MSNEEEVDEDGGFGSAAGQPDEAHDDEGDDWQGVLEPQEGPEDQCPVGLIG